MKRIFIIFAAVLFTATSLMAQSPEKMSYQAVVRDANNDLIKDTQIGMQISILQGATNGSAVYVETQTPTANANGLATIEIGGGTVVSGDFSTIDWSAGPFFIKTETDVDNDGTYDITGINQMLSVPYALNAKTAENVQWGEDNSNIYYEDGNVGIGLVNPTEKLHIIGNTSYAGTEIIRDGNDRPTILITGSFPNIILGSNGNLNHGSTIGFWNYDGIANTFQWNMGGGQQGTFSIGYAKNSPNPHSGINGYTDQYKDALTPFLIDTTGYIGIGTIRPTATLHIKGVNSTEDALRLQINSKGEGQTGIRFEAWTDDASLAAIRSFDIGEWNGDLRFYTDNDNSENENLQERMRLSKDGYLGIGITDPKAPLHIKDFMKLEPRDSAPSNPEEGMVYYDSTDHKLKVYTGSGWESLN